MLVSLMDGSTQTTVRAATLRQRTVTDTDIGPNSPSADPVPPGT